MNITRDTVVSADAVLFSELFNRGRFTVPWHQRYYDWLVSDVKSLLHDIDEAIRENRRCYFLGSVMLVDIEEGRWEINDGQQRMVTISLICAALCRRFAQETNDSQREGLALRMLFHLDGSGVWKLEDSEYYEPRIESPVNDRTRYQMMIRGNSIGTNGNLTGAWQVIEDFLGPTNAGRRWEDYFDFIRERLEVACLRVPSDIDPNAIYETINCRGKRLDDLDLIRNFLYSHFNDSKERQRKDSIHDSLEKIRQVFPTVVRASEYMRCRMQCLYGFLRKDHFYRDVRKAIRTQRDRRGMSAIASSDYVFALTRTITRAEDLALFRILSAPNPNPDIVQAFEVASGTVHSPRNLTVFLRELRGYSVTQPLVFALMAKYIRETDGRKKRKIAGVVSRSLGRLATFVLRTAFVAPKFEPSHFEPAFSNFAMRISSELNVLEDAFVEFLHDCDRSEFGVLNNEKFFEMMASATMRGNSKIKQLILGINRYERPESIIVNESQCTVEHVLPVSPEHWGTWTEFGGVDSREWVHRIGNLTLMSSADNKPGSRYNSNFSKKRESYQDSSVAVTRALSEYDEWSPENIEKRQYKLAKIAVRVWEFK